MARAQPPSVLIHLRSSTMKGAFDLMKLLMIFSGLLLLAGCVGDPGQIATPTPMLPLQSYINTAGAYMLDYPIGWQLREEGAGQIVILPPASDDATPSAEAAPELLMRIKVLESDPGGVSLMRAVDAQRERVLAAGGRILLQNDFTFMDGNYGVQRLIELPGTLDPVQEAVILAEVSGRILEISGRGDLATWNQLAIRVRASMGLIPTPAP